MVWEETQIKEETEDGGSVESKISLPVYSSSYVNTILYSLSTELYRIGCHGFTEGEVPLMLGEYLYLKVYNLSCSEFTITKISINLRLIYLKIVSKLFPGLPLDQRETEYFYLICDQLHD